MTQFVNKVMGLIKDFQEEVKKNYVEDLKAYRLPNITASNELAYRLWKNCEHIKEFDSLRGYVVLDDETIICVNSSSYIAQFDGCKRSDIGL